MFEKKIICASCGNVDKPKWKVKGSLLVEIILFLMFIIPWILYALIFRTSAKVCRHCGSEDIVPLDSPRGKKLAAEYAE